MNDSLLDFMMRNNAIAEQDLYLKLTNNRESKINDYQHKHKVVNGYGKIMALINKGVK